MKSIRSYVACLCLALFAFGLSTSAARSAVLFAETYDNIRLNGGAGVTLTGDRNGTISGSSVLFGTSLSTTSLANYLNIDVFGAGVLSEATQYKVTIDVVEDRTTGPADKDTLVGIQNGARFLTSNWGDNGGGSHQTAEASVSAGALQTLSGFANFVPAQTRLGTTGVVSYSVSFDIGTIDAASLLSPVAVGPINTSQNFDVTQGLTLSLFGADSFETYGFQSISVTVEDNVVPEPGSIAIFGIALIGLRCIRRRAAA